MQLVVSLEMLIPILFFIAAFLYTYYHYQKRVNEVNMIPHLTQLFGTMHILVQLNLVSVAWNRDSPWEKKWDNFYKGFGSDIITIISPFSTHFLVGDADIAKEMTTLRKEFFPKPIQ